MDKGEKTGLGNAIINLSSKEFDQFIKNWFAYGEASKNIRIPERKIERLKWICSESDISSYNEEKQKIIHPFGEIIVEIFNLKKEEKERMEEIERYKKGDY